MDPFIVALCVLCSISLFINIAILITVRTMRSDVSLTRSDVIAIRRQLIPAAVGGRAVPSPADIQAARNRTDAMGTAHPGGPA